MGFISAIAGIGSALIGAKSASKQASAQAAATQASIDASLTGFRYLRDNEGVNQAQTQGAMFGQQVGQELGPDGRFQQMLGMGQSLMGMGDGSPESQQRAQQAFQNYQNSTGFQFRMGQGMNAITGNAASRGLLNSGATLQGLNDYGQGMGSQEFGNFMNQFQTQMSNQQNFIGMLASERDTGLNAAYNVASSGGSGGAGAANSIMQGAASTNAINQAGTNNIVAGLGAAAGGFTDMYNKANGITPPAPPGVTNNYYSGQR